MITLYVKTGCRYCAKVLGALDAREIAYEERNIASDEVCDELTQRGGKCQVPYLVDGETEMYESDDIVAYIEKTYRGNTEGEISSSGVRIHYAGGRCGESACTNLETG